MPLSITAKAQARTEEKLTFMFIECHVITFRILGEIISYDGNEACKSCISESKWENSANPSKSVYSENQIWNDLSREQINAEILAHLCNVDIKLLWCLGGRVSLPFYQEVGKSDWLYFRCPSFSLSAFGMDSHDLNYFCLWYGYRIELMMSPEKAHRIFTILEISQLKILLAHHS